MVGSNTRDLTTPTLRGQNSNPLNNPNSQYHPHNNRFGKLQRFNQRVSHKGPLITPLRHISQNHKRVGNFPQIPKKLRATLKGPNNKPLTFSEPIAAGKTRGHHLVHKEVTKRPFPPENVEDSPKKGPGGPPRRRIRHTIFSRNTNLPRGRREVIDEQTPLYRGSQQERSLRLESETLHVESAPRRPRPASTQPRRREI